MFGSDVHDPNDSYQGVNLEFDTRHEEEDKDTGPSSKMIKTVPTQMQQRHHRKQKQAPTVLVETHEFSLGQIDEGGPLPSVQSVQIQPSSISS